MLKLGSKMYPWLVIGISGVTCGGKTSLTLRLRDLLNQYFFSRKKTVNILTLSQDDFFLKPEDPRHVFLPSLGHNNWELPTAVDLNKMHQKALGIISGKENAEIEKTSNVEMEAVGESKFGLKGILLIEGFLCLNHEPTRTLCHLGYYIVLSRTTCEKRRLCRTYDPPDIPGYFEQVVWPEHVYRRSEVIGKGILVDRSDPLSMIEVQQALDEENIIKENVLVVTEDSKDNQSNSPTQGKRSVELFQNSDFTTTADKCENSSKMLIVDDFGSYKSDNLWMRRGVDVQELKGDFGECGLGVVNGIRVLNGGVISKEDMAQKVFQDVLREIKSIE